MLDEQYVFSQIWDEAARLGRAVSEWSHTIQTDALVLSSFTGFRSGCKCMRVPFKIANESHLAGRHMSAHIFIFVCPLFFFLHDLCTFLYLEASHSIFQCFCLSLVMHGTLHKHAKKTRTLSSRQMAAVSSSGRGGHGRCPAETAWGIDWSETLAFRFSFPVCLLSPKVTLSRQWPHVTSSTLPGCLAER